MSSIGAYLLTEKSTADEKPSSEEMAGQLIRTIGTAGTDGLDIKILEARTGFDAAMLMSLLSSLQSGGLIETTGNGTHYRLTEFGTKAQFLVA
jgi:DNA-binding IclR family transcriptional regulator